MDLKWESNFISNFFNISCKYQQELGVSFFPFERIILRRSFVIFGRPKRSGTVGPTIGHFNHMIISWCSFQFSKICSMILIKRPFKIISKNVNIEFCNVFNFFFIRNNVNWTFTSIRCVKYMNHTIYKWCGINAVDKKMNE